MKTENSYTGMFVDPSTGSESATLLSEPLNKKYRMSNLHVLDWQWTPEKGSPAWSRKKTRTKPIGSRHIPKMHIKGIGCYWETRRRGRLVNAEEFKRGKDWEQCVHCMAHLQDLVPVTKPKRIPLERLKPGHYVEPVNYTKAEREYVEGLARTHRDLETGRKVPSHHAGGNSGSWNGMR